MNEFSNTSFGVFIYNAIFAMPIRIPPFLSCGCYLLVSFLVGLFLACVLLSFPGFQLNVESLLSHLIYAFHTMKLQLSSDMAEKSSKVLHHHPWFFEGNTQPDGLPPKLISVFLHSLSLFFLKVLPLHELFLFVAYGIEL
jgi:hypothetical protein